MLLKYNLTDDERQLVNRHIEEFTTVIRSEKRAKLLDYVTIGAGVSVLVAGTIVWSPAFICWIPCWIYFTAKNMKTLSDFYRRRKVMVIRTAQTVLSDNRLYSVFRERAVERGMDGKKATI